MQASQAKVIRIHFTFSGEPGLQYVVETSDDLAKWVPIFTTPVGCDRSRRVYRHNVRSSEASLLSSVPSWAVIGPPGRVTQRVFVRVSRLSGELSRPDKLCAACGFKPPLAGMCGPSRMIASEQARAMEFAQEGSTRDAGRPRADRGIASW